MDSTTELSEEAVPNTTNITVVKRELEKEGDSSSSDRNSQEDSQDSDDEAIYPENLLKVEVNESDEVISPVNFIQKEPIKRKLLDSLPGTKKSARLQNKPRKAVYASDSDEEKKDDKYNYYEEEYVCKVCQRKCPNKAKLKRHIKSHKGDVKCPVCAAPFVNKKVMGKHVVLAHKKSEKCEKCPAVFYTKEQLQEHNQKNKHKIKPEPTENFVELNELMLVNRKDVSYDIQAAIVSKMHKAVPVKDICKLYNIAADVVNEIWNDRNQFILPKKVGRRTIAYINNILEPLLLDWYHKEKTKDVYITGRMIQNVAEQIAREKGFVHFNAGNKWLERFKKRHSIYLSNRKERTKSPSDPVWKIKWFEDHWQKLRVAYTDDEIYTADEVGLFYNPSKSRERKFAGKKFVQGEMEDRLSIFLCTNMSGTDKRKLLVCGTEDPLKNLNSNPCTLPVEYKRHTQCHFTTDMFEEYVQKWNADLSSKNQKAVVLLDRATIHSKLDLSNLHLEFLPWKAMNTLMPVRNGIYAKFRAEFRNLLLQFKIGNVLRGQDRYLTCLEGLEMLEKAWERTPSYVISKSFVDVGFEVQEMKDTDNFQPDVYGEKFCEILRDYDVESYFIDPNTLDMYLTVDEDLLVGKGTRPSLFGGNHKAKDDVVIFPTDTGKDLPLNTGLPVSNYLELYMRNLRIRQAEAEAETIRKLFST
ncbi:DDE superfamily endonuclease domain-containing protein [Phthorimaea operculella]|nr:DDE superfamily endonuclease domain-containing protein [Phthorimaea operculella]